jgi:hypothetical protein
MRVMVMVVAQKGSPPKAVASNEQELREDPRQQFEPQWPGIAFHAAEGGRWAI